MGNCSTLALAVVLLLPLKQALANEPTPSNRVPVIVYGWRPDYRNGLNKSDLSKLATQKVLASSSFDCVKGIAVAELQAFHKDRFGTAMIAEAKKARGRFSHDDVCLEYLMPVGFQRYGSFIWYLIRKSKDGAVQRVISGKRSFLRFRRHLVRNARPGDEIIGIHQI